MQWTVPYNTKQYIMVYKLHRKQPRTQDILAVENFGPDWPLLFTLQCTKFGQLIVRKKSLKFLHPDAFLRCKVCQKCLQHFSRPLVEFKGPTSKKRGEEGGEGRRGEGKGKVGVGGERKERERVIPVLLFLLF